MIWLGLGTLALAGAGIVLHRIVNFYGDRMDDDIHAGEAMNHKGWQ